MIQEKFPITSSGKMFDGHYKLIRPLSTEGGTADVWLAIDTNTIDIAADGDGCVVENGNDGSGMLVAIKIYRPKNALDIDGEQRFRDEFKIVYECRHENLLQPTNFSICEGIPYLVLPYCERGSSEQLVGKRLSADEIWKFILNVSSGLNRLHTNVPSIVHQDIKPANILIDNTGEYAITDFGISAKRGGEHGFYYDDENSGTMAYMAPERFHDNAAPMSPSDIWAFGATLYEILMGSVPFGEDGGRFQTEKSTSALSFANVPSDIQRLISDCLAYEPGQRPSAAVIKEAATARKYPLRGWQTQAALLGGVAMAFVVAIVALFWLPDKGNEPPTTEELYNIALANIDSADTSAVKHGMALMENVSNMGYIPAMYQIAYTYGWYREEKSLERKRMLGIDVCEDRDGDLCFPKDDRYNNEAIALFLKILELNDSAFAEINAQAAYRLACYYVNDNGILKKKEDEGKRYLLLSRMWAELSQDTALLHNIDKSLDSFNKNQK